MYSLDFSDEFKDQFKKLVKGNKILRNKFESTLLKLSESPFYPSLKTHKVKTKKYDDVWSSSVSGDVRIIWAFNKSDDLVILILETGTHSGANQVYKNKSS